MEKQLIRENLEKSALSKDHNQIYDALQDMFQYGHHLLFVEPLIMLLELDCHNEHEDITRTLQQLKDERAIDILFSTAKKKFQYLEYNDSKALARKCTWALADIGTLKAKEALSILSKDSDKVIAGYAQKRLDNWEKELHRK